MLVVALALALPATAAAKGPVSAELCGPDECRAVAVALAFPYLEGAVGPPALAGAVVLLASSRRPMQRRIRVIQSA